MSSLLLGAAAGCSGGASSLPVATPHIPAGTQSVRKAALLERSHALLSGPCPPAAIFVRLGGEIRGYPLAASGAATPCTDIIGAQTLLTGNGNGYGAIAVSVYGYLHALAFQSNGPGGLMVFPPDTAGNAPPSRAVNVDQDHVALAVDSAVNDYVVAGQNYSGDNCWYVVPAATLAPSGSSCDPNVLGIYGLAMTPHDELVVLGMDAVTNAARVDILANATTATPTLVRSIAGPATGLPAGTGDYFADGFSIAVDPVAGTVYVYSADNTGLTPPQIAAFAPTASGNVPPLRTIVGPDTQLPKTAFATNVLAVDTASNLYVNSSSATQTQLTISVFAANATGDALPSRTINDPTLSGSGSGGIAVRSTL